MKRKLFLYSLLVLLFFTTCKKEETSTRPLPVPETPEPPKPILIDPAFASYIDVFVAEGATRGTEISTQGLEAYLVSDFSISTVRNQGFGGYGWSEHPFTGNPRIEIIENLWNNLTEYQRDKLVTHELGHALLNRGHRDGRLSFNGFGQRSIMCSLSCYQRTFLPRSGPLRSYYFDELFFFDTPIPTFINKDSLKRVVLKDDFENGINDWEFVDIRYGNVVPNYQVQLDTAKVDNDSKTLWIKSDKTHTEDASILVLKQFDLTDFGPCANLRATANFRTKNHTDGFFEIGFSIQERAENGQLQRIFLDQQKQYIRGVAPTYYEDFQLEVFCIPEEVETFAVSITYNSASVSNLYIDDVRVELLE